MDTQVTRRSFGKMIGMAGASALALSAVSPLTGLAASDPITNPTTGHRMDGGFAFFWHANGSLAIFGWPISNLEDEVLEDGNTYKVQYTERSRFEYHPNGDGTYFILLGAFGRRVLALRGGGGSGSCSNVGSPLAQTQPGAVGWGFNLPAHPNLDDLPKTTIQDAPRGQWFHRVYNPDWFHAPDWGGADSWFTTLAILRENGGQFRSFGTPGMITFRQSQSYAEFQLAVLTTARWRDQFLAGAQGPVQMNIRTAPGAYVSLVGPGGDIRISQRTSDMGDITINLPDECRVTVACAPKIHDENGETIIWFGPTDRTSDIDLINGPEYQWS